MDKYVDQLRRKMLLMRSFLGLSWWKSTRFWEGKLSKIKDRVTVKDQLTKRIDNLAGLEKNTQMEISEAQKIIAQLEIENNLFRRDIHNSQFDRIKLLKEMNNLVQKNEDIHFSLKSKTKVSNSSVLVNRKKTTDPKH